ncbi:hypothetical protein ACFV42_40965 [Streptomyces solisilvae]|uniref:hypothetical protein n=1 Tax=Streptomyces malaysiensis TaxID=92644 RepID=UPI00367B8E6C
MIVSLVSQMTRKLLAIPTLLWRRDAAKNAELLVLRHHVVRRGVVDEFPEIRANRGRPRTSGVLSP